MEPGTSTAVDKLTLEDGQALLWLARQTIAQRLWQAVADPPGEISQTLASPRLQERRGVFVTLKSNGQLRGCIGSLQPVGSIVEGVRDNALKAAFGDPRFPGLSVEELAAVQIEISVLTPLKPLSYQGSEELVARLRPDRDGVLIEQGGLSATFLPQVWKQLPQPENFLAQLCLKAGLPATAWQSGQLKVETYQVQSFAEK
ncbi:AmmeMemoRadiSam system protein A [Desulfurivibrio alkaliphilus]|uniref:AMMECR1 domain protein n=1 Tax=Desulfurivibrio alkaliphilus (strain DSM 19089 / UNIQEM U267 / AHT2) TaxID=589865 RepID=D6Z334_DESAT|nr:AmmeMemoRadiSam system protein A [Desulfurivibrio alkaliphilus]ADH85959.1 AMMECR1 domain protein [Desulfurivibrio alkaliphilus AHT 2]